jgi:hypothetical protein
LLAVIPFEIGSHKNTSEPGSANRPMSIFFKLSSTQAEIATLSHGIAPDVMSKKAAATLVKAEDAGCRTLPL